MNSHREKYKEAKWWEPHSSGKILCTLCPRYCTIGKDQYGFCYIRQNINNQLVSIGYGNPTGFAIDPIEKKPLNHFLPGSKILSFGTLGCNLGCKFCQNWSISKSKNSLVNSIYVSPEDVVAIAKKNNTPSIAFTYNDPIIFGEYVIDVSKIARAEKIKSVLVTAGYVDKHARKEAFEFIDAANVDLKAFSEMFYYKLTFAHLDPILDTLRWIKNETNIWLEITTLLIPQENDTEDEIKKMCSWILSNLGDDVPIHFTAFHPNFKMMNKLTTPISTLIKAREIALSLGIKYCYLGNVNHAESQSTYCFNCGALLIQRNGYKITKVNFTNNFCENCGTIISGIYC